MLNEKKKNSELLASQNSYVLGWPVLSQITAHLILITALQGDSFHLTEEETEAPAGAQLGQAHSGHGWPS